MLNLDKVEIEKLLMQLENMGFFDLRYKFHRVNHELNLLGSGGFSYVYEMYDSQNPERRYAAKVIGLGSKAIDEEFILDTTQIQYFLSEQSKNILRVIDLWVMKLQLDDKGDILGIVGVNEDEYLEDPGLVLQIILMEKLDNIFYKDKYGNISQIREELKTEQGVIKFAKHISKALLTVHNNSFLHRDVKLENIFWDKKLQEYKLGDFGIARYIGDGDAETVVFTDGYGAPEIERKLTDSYNETADIYSFGITLFLLLNDFKFPASEGYYVNIVQYSKNFIFPAPANASEDMARIIRKMCSYKAEERYQSMEEILGEFERLEQSIEKKEFTEYGDILTETYRDEDGGATETYREQETEETTHKENNCHQNKHSKLTREERKKREKKDEQIYIKLSIWNVCILALLFWGLFESFSVDVTYDLLWQSWLFPVVLVIEAILLKLKEFYIGFSLMAIGLCVFCAYLTGINVICITMIIVLMIGIPSISIGCAMALSFWAFQMWTNKISCFDFMYQKNLGWIVIIALYTVIENIIFQQINYNKMTVKKVQILFFITDKIWYVLILAGIVLFLLESFNVIILPEFLRDIHLVRIGLGFCVVGIYYLKKYGLLGDVENEFVDT